MHTPVTATAPRARRRPTAVLALVAGLLGVFVALVGPAGQARAANYEYWAYWSLSAGKWTFAQAGPAQTTPADGAVEGWRYSVDDGSGARTPRVTPTFGSLCPTISSPSGTKRVGVVVDYGRAADGDGVTTPPDLQATCVTVPVAATGADVLAAAGIAVRTKDSLVCGIGGYPATGCAPEVPALTEAQKAADTPLTLPTPTPSATPAGSGSAAPTTASGGAGGTGASGATTAVWITLAVVLAGVLAWLARRRRPAGS